MTPELLRPILEGGGEIRDPPDGWPGATDRPTTAVSAILQGVTSPEPIV
jgi:hypothetical protein